ncbi:class I SAM-dependent methyltransferase [Microbulbifer sp. SAOS-129_SWC]|uniref:class I SAM-dependent methyltransferase n=1 Tax=Microbulbifer sp. SAOS-129_SWC TaxID=3145235 RepID=UPI0032169C30
MTRASLEELVESGMLSLDSLHPGGLETTRQLAELCHIASGTRVLDVASGSGASACFLTQQFGARVYGVDHSGEMVRRAQECACAKELDVAFARADAVNLPFADAEFDVAICECTLCFLDKTRVLSEMARVVRPGGYVGMHDLCWQPDAPAGLKRALAEREGERPETLEGWRQLFGKAGLIQLETVDISAVKSRWMGEMRRQLGAGGQLRLALQIIRRWGLRGAWGVFRSERLLSSDCLGYGLVVGRKR